MNSNLNVSKVIIAHSRLQICHMCSTHGRQQKLVSSLARVVFTSGLFLWLCLQSGLAAMKHITSRIEVT